MYERVGFRKTGERPSPASFAGALLDYEFLPPPAGNAP